MYLKGNKRKKTLSLILLGTFLLITYERANFPAPLILLALHWNAYFLVYISLFAGLIGTFWAFPGKYFKLFFSFWIFISWVVPIIIMYYPTIDDPFIVHLLSSAILSSPFLIVWIIFTLDLWKEVRKTT